MGQSMIRKTIGALGFLVILAGALLATGTPAQAGA